MWTRFLTANHTPFRLILRGNETWSPSGDDLFHNRYDYVKLSRISTFIPIIDSDHYLIIFFDGTIGVSAVPPFTDPLHLLKVANQYLGLLLLGGLYCDAILPENVHEALVCKEGYTRPLGWNGSIIRLHSNLKLMGAGYLDRLILKNPKTINIDQLHEYHKRGKSIFESISKISLDTIMNASSFYTQHLWANSLLFSWVSCEQLINKIWEKEIVKTSGTRIKGRKAQLEDYRTWSTSSKIEMLHRLAFIDIETYDCLNTARKSRNNFIHSNTAIKKNEAKSSIESLFRLISLIKSQYLNPTELEPIITLIEENVNPSMFAPRETLSTNHPDPSKRVVSAIPIYTVLPGDDSWGDREYERIPEITLGFKEE